MWAANKLDIEATLRHVCKRLLSDEQASPAAAAVPALPAVDANQPAGCFA